MPPTLGTGIIRPTVEELTWYGVRTVCEHVNRNRRRDRLYEERIVLIRATSFDEALVKAEDEVNCYAVEGTRYLGYAMAFELFEEPGEGIEVFSLMRESRLEPKRYVDKFFDTGRERSH